MIPKKIHYVWLGKGKKKPLANICINSWFLTLTDYEITEWNEDNLNLDELCAHNRFLSECRKRKLWAFMADYLRLYILYQHGGIYMDVDVQVLKKFDNLLDRDFFIGYEYYTYNEDNSVTEGTGVIAAAPHNPIIKKCLDYYDSKIWETDVYFIPTIFTIVLKEFNPSEYTIYPVEYFAPYDYRKSFGYNSITPDTYAIHWFDGSWTSNKHVGQFLKVKHIKNPIIKFALICKYSIQHYIFKCKQAVKVLIK